MTSRPITVNSNGKFSRLANGDLDPAVLPADYQRGVAGGLATLDGAGQIPTGQLPAIAITDVFIVASQAEMLALTAEKGDVAVRTDIAHSFILAASPASTLANWVDLGSTAGGAVPSVFGRTGAVIAVAGDYNASQITVTPVGGISSTNVQAAIQELDTEKANLVSPALTGTPTAPTATAGTNTTQLATTAFVQAAIASAAAPETDISLTSGVNVADTVTISTVKAVWWELVLYKGTAIYQTTVQASHDGTSAYYVQISPVVVGTVDIATSIDISGGNMRLLFTASTTGWAARFRKRTLAV